MRKGNGFMEENKNLCRILWNGIYPWLAYLLISCTAGYLLAVGACLFYGFYGICYDSTPGTGWFEMEQLPQWFLNNYALLSSAISAAFAIPVLLRMFQTDRLQRGNPPVKRLGGQKGYLLVLGFSACIAGNNLIKISQIGTWFPGYQEAVTAMDVSWLWLNLAVAGILAPVVEELVFRALMFYRFRDRYSFWMAAFLSSAAFGMFHGNMVQGVYAAVLGMVLAYGYEQCQSFLAPVLLHSSMNLTSILFNRVIPPSSFTGSGTLFYPVTLAAFISCIYCMLHLRKTASEKAS